MANILETIIGFFNPERAAEREAWRQELEFLRGANYDSAGRDRINAGWRVYNEAAEYTDRNSRDVIRARARDLERNSDMMGSVISAYKRNVIGHGYTLQASTGDPELDDIIEQEWKIWCKKQHCDITGQQSLNQMLRMAVARKKIDGGILLLKTYTGKGVVPFQLQALEVDELATNHTTPKKKGNKVIGGIELDPYNRPVGYWIEKYTLDGWSVSDPEYIPAERIIYLYQKKRPSQIREISDMSSALPRIRDANELMTAVSVKERIAACLSVFIKKSYPTQAGGYGRGMVTTDGKMEYNGKMLTPGMITEMNPGDEVQVVDPKGSYGEAEGMLKIQQRLISAGQGLSYETVSRDMSGVNYSSARQGVIEDDMTFAEDIELIKEVMDEIYETFIISCYLAGVFDMPGFFEDRKLKRKYLTHTWVSSPKPWIDPVKEANANKTAMESGLKTFAELSSENGRDWKEKIDEIAEVTAYCKEKGVTLGGELYSYEQGQNDTTEAGNTNQ
jgi:lambda family phage portal protein